MGGCPTPSPARGGAHLHPHTWEGTGLCTQHSFLMALYTSALVPVVMHSSSCTLSCVETQHSSPEMRAHSCKTPPQDKTPTSLPRMLRMVRT